MLYKKDVPANTHVEVLVVGGGPTAAVGRAGA